MFLFSFSSSWDNFLNDFLSDGIVASMLTNCLRANCHSNSTSDILHALAKCDVQNDVSTQADIVTKQAQQMFDMFENGFEISR
jgi:hypothetical protein